MPLIVVIAFLLITSLLLVFASTSIGSGFYIKALCRIKTQKKEVLLTFDDGPHPIYTVELLAVLKRHNIQALFFLIGQNAEKYPEIVTQIVSDGHLIGNHTNSHSSWFPLFLPNRMKADIEQCTSTLCSITNSGTKLFRPPFGVTNPTIARAVRQLGYKTIGWSIRSLDTQKGSRLAVATRVVNKIHPGAIILLHDNRAHCANLVEMIIDRVKAKGYEFKRMETVTELLIENK